MFESFSVCFHFFQIHVFWKGKEKKLMKIFKKKKTKKIKAKQKPQSPSVPV